MKLVIATGDYAHTRLLKSRERLEHNGHSVQVQTVTDRPAALFRRALSPEQPYDVSELSLATTYVLADRGDRRLAPLPVFPSRMFRHASFYVGEGVRTPVDLRGRRIGVVRYGMTAAVWARALLAEQYGIAPGEMEWWIGEPQFFRPAELTLHEAGSQAALETMLVEGKLDCLFSVSVPAAFREGRVRRLFPDFAAEERAQFQRTGLYPIMHCLVMKQSLVEALPWLPPLLLAACREAKEAALRWLTETDVSTLPLPFQHGWAEEMRGMLGEDPWPYGMAANRGVLEAFGSAMHAQGLTGRALSPEEVFTIA